MAVSRSPKPFMGVRIPLPLLFKVLKALKTWGFQDFLYYRLSKGNQKGNQNKCTNKLVSKKGRILYIVKLNIWTHT